MVASLISVSLTFHKSVYHLHCHGVVHAIFCLNSWMPIKLASLLQSAARLTFLKCALGSIIPPLRTLHGFSSLNWRPSLYMTSKILMTSWFYLLSLFSSLTLLQSHLLASCYSLDGPRMTLPPILNAQSSAWNVLPCNIFLIPSLLVLPDVYSNIILSKRPSLSSLSILSSPLPCIFFLLYILAPLIYYYLFVSYCLSPLLPTQQLH